MSHPPSTPVKVPPSATTYTPATLDQDLRSQINSLLLREGHIEKIQEQMLHALDSHNSNWPSIVQSHALTLLRTGEISTFPALVRRVLEDVRHETQQASSGSSASSTSNSSSSTTTTATTEKNGIDRDGTNGVTTNGTTTTNGNSSRKGGAVVNGVSAGHIEGSSNSNNNPLAIPSAVVEVVLKVTRESLEAVCEVDDGSAGG